MNVFGYTAIFVLQGCQFAFRDLPRTPHDTLNMCSTMQEPPFARDLSPNTLRQAVDAPASLRNGNQIQIPAP